MILSLIAIAILSDIAIPVRSEGLGVTAYTERTGIVRPGDPGRLMPPMLRVGKVDPGKPGASTGLLRDDKILGVAAYDATKPEDIAYPPITPRAFELFPYATVNGNTMQSMLVYRPSLDATAELPVRSSGEPQSWPSGQLGAVVKDVPLASGIPAGMPRRTSWVEVIRVHPYSLADRLGILPRDVFVGVMIEGRPDDDGLEFMPYPSDIASVADLTRILGIPRADPKVTVVKFQVRREDRTTSIVAVPAAKLR